MRVGILTNTDERCGNAAYARNLSDALLKTSKPHTTIMLTSNTESISKDLCDVVLVNWHPAKVSISAREVKKWQSQKIGVILIHQNSFDTRVTLPERIFGEVDILLTVNYTVVHEPMEVLHHGEPLSTVAYIPHGILEIDIPYKVSLDPPTIGTAGFPFHWKRPDVVVRAAAKLDCYARMFAPEYPGYDYGYQHWYNINPGRTVVYTNWLSEENVIKILHENIFNIFWYQSHDIHDQFGQTGSARMGIAANRPMIISRHRKFRDLLRYEDALYICDTEEEVYKTAEEIFTKIQKGEPVKYPKAILKDMGWRVSAQKYWNLIDSAAKESV